MGTLEKRHSKNDVFQSDRRQFDSAPGHQSRDILRQNSRPSPALAVCLKLGGNIKKRRPKCLGSRLNWASMRRERRDEQRKKLRASLSYRVAMRRKSFSLQKQRSMTFRPW